MTLAHRRILGYLAAIGIGALGTCAHATLGEDEASVTRDQGSFGGSLGLLRDRGFNRYTHSLASGLTIRQFVSPPGQVFAVAWDGPVLPDFETLLGTHAGAYVNAVRQRRRGPVVQQPGIVIESSGMMRAFVGRVYLPDRVPPGVVLDDIR